MQGIKHNPALLLSTCIYEGTLSLNAYTARAECITSEMGDKSNESWYIIFLWGYLHKQCVHTIL